MDCLYTISCPICLERASAAQGCQGIDMMSWRPAAVEEVQPAWLMIRSWRVEAGAASSAPTNRELRTAYGQGKAKVG